jgi:DNA-binding MarR family transcriptional regulator
MFACGLYLVLVSVQPPPEHWRAWQLLFETYALVTPELDARLHTRDGLSLRRLDVLLHLSQAGESLTMRELADRAVISTSGLSGLIDRMERDGLLTREPAPGDRRSTRVVITAPGRVQFARAWAAHERDVVELILSRFTADRLETLAAILEPVHSELAARRNA